MAARIVRIDSRKRKTGAATRHTGPPPPKRSGEREGARVVSFRAAKTSSTVADAASGDGAEPGVVRAPRWWVLLSALTLALVGFVGFLSQAGWALVPLLLGMLLIASSFFAKVRFARRQASSSARKRSTAKSRKSDTRWGR